MLEDHSLEVKKKKKRKEEEAMRKLRHNIRTLLEKSQDETLIVIRTDGRASLVAQWLRICLPMQGTRVRALVWEDPTCRGATRPMSHNY